MKHAAEPLESRTLLAAGDPDLNFGVGGFVTGQTPPIFKLINTGSGLIALSTTGGATAPPDLVLSRLLPNGSFDPGFGVNGRVTIGKVNDIDVPIDIAPAPNGQIVVLAQRIDTAQQIDEQYIVRLNANGGIDNTLTANAEIVVATGSQTTFASIATDPTGAIYVGGSSPGFIVIRKFDSSGIPDAAFGTTGELNLTGTTGSQITQLILSATTVTAIGADFNNGFIHRRSTVDGSPDPSFAGGTSATIPGVAPISDARIDGLGRIIVMGFDFSGALISRFTSNGAVDTTFGVGGQASLGATPFNNLDLTAGDNILVAGANGDTLVVRRLLAADGATDNSYGTGGDALAQIPGGSNTQGVRSIVGFLDGSAIVAGGDLETGDSFFLARLLGDTPAFAFLDPQTGVLTVTGTANADNIQIDLTGPTLRAGLGPDSLFFNNANVLLISIDSGGGSDIVVIAANVIQPVQAFLGGGNNRFTAGAGNCTVLGGSGRDIVTGGPGNDLIQTFAGSDSIFGGGGNDTIDTGSGGDSVDGADGDDSLTGGDGPDFIDGAPGNDILTGRDAGDSLFGGPGDDLIFGEAGDDTLVGGPGNDTLFGAEGVDLLDGGDDNDTLDAGPNGGTISGGLGNDSIRGGGGADIIDGGGGNDTIFGFGGADNILGGDGDDNIDTGSGGDFASGGAGNDSITGGDGADVIDGAAGNDTIFGRAGNDTLMGGEGRDRIDGEDGDDAIIGGGGNDLLFGGPGRDELSGTMGSDTLDGGAGNDRLFGGDDNDTLMGGAGSDTLDGQRGIDLLSGGADNDLLLCDDGAIDRIDGNGGIDIARGDNNEDYVGVELIYRILGRRL